MHDDVAREPEQLTFEDVPAKDGNASEVERERDALRRAVSGGKFDTMLERVAWVLNHYPEARDSDITLQLEYWDAFDQELFEGDYIHRTDLYKLTRLTSLARARATIQNKYKLFVASSEIQKRRGTLAEEEREKVVAQQPVYPLLTVYADESGKTQQHLIVGSVWFLHAPELLTVLRRIQAWREQTGFHEELHFKTITEAKLPHYRSFADLLAEQSGVLSFKTISVERAGITRVEEGLARLYYLLLVRGIEHEHDSGRAPLPRGVQLVKDLEEPGRDRLMLADLRERLRQASKLLFDEKLSVDELSVLDSSQQPLLQIADLYTSSINRVMNATGRREGAKDQFADYLLERLGTPRGPQSIRAEGDVTVHVSL